MKTSRVLLMLVLCVQFLACGDNRQAASESQQSEPDGPIKTAAATSVEGISFRGDPLFRNPVAPERLAELESQITPLEARTSLTEDEYITLGRLYIAANRYRDAVDLYTRGIEEHPDSFKLRRHRGHRYINLRELDRAIVDLRKAVELIGDEHADQLEYDASGTPTATYEHWVWYHIGLYHYLNEEWDEAARAYGKCVATSTTNTTLVGAIDWQYNALMKGGRMADAEAALDNVPTNIDTNREHPYFKRVMVYKGEIDPSEVIDIEKPAGEWTGFDITAGYGIGNWYRFNGDAETAVRIHEKILQTPYWNAWAYVVADREFSNHEQKK